MSSILHFLTPSHQDLRFPERYNREDNLSLEVLQRMSSIFLTTYRTVTDKLVSAGAESGSCAERRIVLDSPVVVEQPCATAALVTTQEEAEVTEAAVVTTQEEAEVT